MEIQIKESEDQKKVINKGDYILLTLTHTNRENPCVAEQAFCFGFNDYHKAWHGDDNVCHLIWPAIKLDELYPKLEAFSETMGMCGRFFLIHFPGTNVWFDLSYQAQPICLKVYESQTKSAELLSEFWNSYTQQNETPQDIHNEK